MLRLNSQMPVDGWTGERRTCNMENVIPMSWLNQTLLLLSVLSAALCLIVQQWAGLALLPIYVSISWAILVTVVSIWLSCVLFRLTLKMNRPIDINLINKWVYNRLGGRLRLNSSHKEKTISTIRRDRVPTMKVVNDNAKDLTDTLKNKSGTANDEPSDRTFARTRKALNADKLTREIRSECLDIWYDNISDDKTFPNEAEQLLQKLSTNLFRKIGLIDKIKLANKIADVILLHLKEYRRALRRIEKGSALNIEEAYKSLHPGSRGTPALEHVLRRLVTVLAQEFLQWELTSSLPCKLLLSILSKRLFVTIDTVSSPEWIFDNLLALLESVPERTAPVELERNANSTGVVSAALNGGMLSAAAAVIPRPLPKPLSDCTFPVGSPRQDNSTIITSLKPSLYLEGLAVEHRGLWNDSCISEADSEADEDRISPVYEEPTDFATTIARLRSLLQQKSTATTPLHTEEKSYAVCEGSQFTNLSIPWTEFHTASDGSQQLLYCIQFDDVEQRAPDLFETTTATVRRQYSDFVQLHATFGDIPCFAGIVSGLVLPKGGRVKMEHYLKTLCTRLANDSPPQLRHFLRPNSSTGKKADAVAPRLDRFLAKTVSGVFNTLKTVVPGFEIDQEEDIAPLPTLMPLADIPWRFVQDVKSGSFADELHQLVTGKPDCCSVDTAYEAVESIEGNGDSELLNVWWETVNSSYDEEVDDLDSNLALTCATLDLICELLAGIGSSNTLQQEAVARWVKLLLGNITEPIIRKSILLVSDCLACAAITHDGQFQAPAERVASNTDKILRILEEKVPYDVKLLFGEDDTRKVLRYIIDFCNVKKMNLDLCLQIAEVLASQVLVLCRTSHDSVPF